MLGFPTKEALPRCCNKPPYASPLVPSPARRCRNAAVPQLWSCGPLARLLYAILRRWPFGTLEPKLTGTHCPDSR